MTIVKTLFAYSHNTCYFRACDLPLTNPEWDQVRAEIAHIKGDKPGSARYDEDQSEEDRQAFENLMLLCPNHHTELDDLQPDAYSVEFLMKMAEDHIAQESRGGEVGLFTDEERTQFARWCLIASGYTLEDEDVRQASAATETRSSTQPATATIMRQSVLDLLRVDITGLDLVNTSEEVAEHIRLVPMGDPGTSLVLAAIPPPSLAPGESWRAGSYSPHFADTAAVRIQLSWTDRGGERSKMIALSGANPAP